MSTEELTGDEAAAARRLGELAGSVDIGAAPYERLVAGGRRRLRRRRMLSTGAAAVLVAAAVGGVAAFGGFDRGAGGAVASPAVATTELAAAASATPSGTPSASATPTAPARDPFTPARTMVGHGTAGGKEWEAWTALWPATATKEDAHRQAELMWEDRHAAIPQLPKPVNDFVDRSWRPGRDQVNLYLVVDGKRQVDDTVHDTPAPGTPTPAPGGVSSEGTMLGYKGGETGAAPVVIAEARSDVAKVVITWADGSTSEAVPVTIADSPTHWYAIAKKPGAEVDTYKYLGADGSVLGTDNGWFRAS